MNAFNKHISTLPVLTTDEEVLGRLLWNAALEEAAKAADAAKGRAEEDRDQAIHDEETIYLIGRIEMAVSLARAIRAMQTTAGATGGEVRS